MSTKTYIIDTSVLIKDPHCINFLQGNVIIPICVIDELDKLKKGVSETGKNAREAIRFLDKLTSNVDNNTLSSGFTWQLDALPHPKVEGVNDDLYGDNRLLECACDHAKKTYGVVLLTNDLNLKLRARALDLEAEDYKENKANFTDLFSGIKTIKQENDSSLDEEQQKELIDSLKPNEFVAIQNEDGDCISIGRKVGNTIKHVKKNNPWALVPKSKEQICAIDLLMDYNVPLVSITGLAGSGKTLVALAAALELVLEKRSYDKVVIYRPMVAVGQDLGFLPGEVDQKLQPWFQPIEDNLELLFSGGISKQEKESTKKKTKKFPADERGSWKDTLDIYLKQGKIEYAATTYLRGRSINNALIIIDEVQNISPHDMKTILTRVGLGTKLVALGDTTQIDSKDLDITDNGLSYIIDKFKDYSLAGHITFTQGERSPLATLASEIL